MSDVERVAAWIADAGHVTVLTGAGISTDSGIPDYRGPNGVWTKDPAAERKATIQAWRTDPELRRDAWQFRVANRDRRLEPNDGHRALVELERLGRLDLLVTQNVDGLHLEAGHDPDRVIEVHGTIREVQCLSCGDRQPTEVVLDRVEAGDLDPHCLDCGGLLKSGTVSFGQALDPTHMQQAEDAVRATDVFLALGTTLAVYPVALLPQFAAASGARVVIVNAEPTVQDSLADVFLLGGLGSVLPSLVTSVAGRLL